MFLQELLQMISVVLSQIPLSFIRMKLEYVVRMKIKIQSP